VGVIFFFTSAIIFIDA